MCWCWEVQVCFSLLLWLFSSEPGHKNVGEITLKQVYEIAKVKQKDVNLQSIPLQSIVSQIINSTRSMGITVVKKRADGQV